MSARYGCHNRRGFVAERTVQDGAWTDGHAFTPKAVSLPNFSRGAACQFTLSDLGRVDPRCDGCKHKDSTQGDA